jgi:cold shock CspA family protein
MQGTVKWYSRERRFGFVTDGNQDFFVHANTLSQTGIAVLTDGAAVKFNVVPSQHRPGKFEATEVRLIGPAAAPVERTPAAQPVQFGPGYTDADAADGC